MGACGLSGHHRRGPTCTHINLFVLIAQLEVLEHRLFLQGFQEHEILHPYGIFPKSHVEELILGVRRCFVDVCSPLETC